MGANLGKNPEICKADGFFRVPRPVWTLAWARLAMRGWQWLADSLPAMGRNTVVPSGVGLGSAESCGGVWTPYSGMLLSTA